MNPTPNSVYVDQVRSELLQSYMQDEAGFVCTKFPWRPVDAQTGLYPVFNKNDMQRDEMQPRPPGTRAETSGWRLSTSGYTCIPYALKKLIDDQTKANANSRGGFVDLEMASIQWLAQKYLIRAERQWSADIFLANTWGGGSGNDYTVSNTWDNQTLGDPLSDVETIKSNVIQSIGRKPNTMIMGYQVFMQLKQHPEIKDQFKYTSDRSITEDMLAGFFGIDNVYVASAIAATNVEGETAVRSFIVGKSVWIGYVAPNAGWGVPSAFYTLYWDQCTDGLPGITGGVVTRYDPDTRSDVYELQSAFCNVITANDAAYLAPNVVA